MCCGNAIVFCRHVKLFSVMSICKSVVILVLHLSATVHSSPSVQVTAGYHLSKDTCSLVRMISSFGLSTSERSENVVTAQCFYSRRARTCQEWNRLCLRQQKGYLPEEKQGHFNNTFISVNTHLQHKWAINAESVTTLRRIEELVYSNSTIFFFFKKSTTSCSQ